MKMIMNDLREAEVFLRQQLPKGGRVLCAVSGGLDSMCLLHFVSSLEGFSVAAAHFNHRLRGEAADRDQSFVEDWCRERAIPCLTGQGDTRKRAAEQGESLEEAARNLRYAFLEEAGAEFDAILTAHHAQDNAETVLLNLLRGTGTAGLGGIPRQRGKFLRPFLPLERETLAAYSAEHHIPYVEDETNAEDAAARNVLRHRVMPVLKELNPRAVEHISRAAAIAAEENVLLEQMAEELAIRAEKKAAVLAAAPEILAGRAALCLLDRHCGGRRDLTARHAQQLLELAEKESGETHFPSGWIARKEGDELSFCCSEELPAVEIRPGESVRKNYLEDKDGFWRLSNYVPSVTFDTCDDVKVIRSAGEAFGDFQMMLSEFDAGELFYTIPNFHHTRKRYAQLKADIAADPCGRVSEVQEEIDWLLSVEDEACRITDMQERGELPLRRSTTCSLTAIRMSRWWSSIWIRLCRA